jgi:hypothetical protein
LLFQKPLGPRPIEIRDVNPVDRFEDVSAKVFGNSPKGRDVGKVAGQREFVDPLVLLPSHGHQIFQAMPTRPYDHEQVKVIARFAAVLEGQYAVEREIKVERDKLGETFTDADVVRLRRTRAGPILATFSDWIDEQRRQVTPKSLFGQAAEYSRNQWASLVRYLDDARFAIDNGAAERAIRPLAIGRANWLHVGGDGGLKSATVLLSVCASATRHRLNPWSYLRDVLDQLAARSAGTHVGDLLPDTWAKRHAQTC